MGVQSAFVAGSGFEVSRLNYSFLKASNFVSEFRQENSAHFAEDSELPKTHADDRAPLCNVVCYVLACSSLTYFLPDIIASCKMDVGAAGVVRCAHPVSGQCKAMVYGGSDLSHVSTRLVRCGKSRTVVARCGGKRKRGHARQVCRKWR